MTTELSIRKDQKERLFELMEADLECQGTNKVIKRLIAKLRSGTNKEDIADVEVEFNRTFL